MPEARLAGQLLPAIFYIFLRNILFVFELVEDGFDDVGNLRWLRLHNKFVIPAKAGIRVTFALIPAFAGMTLFTPPASVEQYRYNLRRS